jgi:hypothetical protein
LSEPGHNEQVQSPTADQTPPGTQGGTVPVMPSTVRRSERGRADKAGRRLGPVGCLLLALSALLVPAGSAAGASPQVPVASAEGQSAPVDATALESDIARVLRSSPGAVRTGPYEVSWDDGAVVSTWVPQADRGSGPGSAAAAGALTARDDGAPSMTSTTSTNGLSAAVGGCPDGLSVHWFCFYENASYGGRMLQFRACPSTQSLGAYGFANQTTSWVNNRSGVTITVYDGSTSGTVLWREYGRSSSSNVGSWANDRADTFTCRT